MNGLLAAQELGAPQETRLVGRERARHRLVKLVFLAYGLLIFEGALRKWVFPDLELVLFFIRVPVLLAIYTYAATHGAWPRTNAPLAVAYAFAWLAAIWIPLQMLLGGYASGAAVLLAGYGWHNYFYYIPLAFLIGEQFRTQDLERLMRWTMWLSLPAAMLVFLQFMSPPSAVVNQGAALDAQHQFESVGAALGYIRPSGFFTSSSGHVQFVVTLVAMLVASWLVRPRRRCAPRWLLVSASAAVALMVALSGTRGLFVYSGLLLATGIGTGLVTGRVAVGWRALFWPVVLVAAFAILWPTVFPTGYDVFMTRWEGAQAAEIQRFAFGIFGRALHGLYGFLEYISQVPLAGYLLGMGGNAATRIAWLPSAPVAAEEGLARHIVELGPVLGLAFIAFRMWFAGWLGLRALRASRFSGHPLPLLFWGYAAVSLATGSITGAGVLQGYTWMFIGFTLAAARQALPGGRWARPPRRGSRVTASPFNAEHGQREWSVRDQRSSPTIRS